MRGKPEASGVLPRAAGPHSSPCIHSILLGLQKLFHADLATLSSSARSLRLAAVIYPGVALPANTR